MSIAYCIDNRKGLTLVRWDGAVSADDFLTHVRRLSSDENWPPAGRLHLADLRPSSLGESMDEAALKRAADLYGQYQSKFWGMRAAVVAGEAFWKAVEFESLISRYGARVIVFNNLPTACTWLGLDAAHIETRIQDLCGQVRDDTHPESSNCKWS